MSNVFCVRAEGGKYANAFKNGGYMAIGWLGKQDLGDISSISEIDKLYRETYPKDGNMTRAVNVHQIARFLTDIRQYDIVLTPSQHSERIYAGKIRGGYYREETPDCPYVHRRRVDWWREPLFRNSFSVPLQNNLKALSTVFRIRPASEILVVLGEAKEEPSAKIEKGISVLVLERILQLSSDEFELLVTELLSSLGFEEADHVGRVGDSGVDVTGTLRVSTLASINLTVQVKRYKRTSTINAKTIRDFRGAVPDNSEAAFVTTARFTKNARKEAVKPDFKKIGLVDGNQLVDLLAAHYENLSEELKDKLSLRLALIAE